MSKVKEDYLQVCSLCREDIANGDYFFTDYNIVICKKCVNDIQLVTYNEYYSDDKNAFEIEEEN